MIFSPSDPFDKSFFRVPKILTQFLGVWPLDAMNVWTKFKAFINIAVILTAMLGELRMTLLLHSEPVEALHTICLVLTKTTTCLKLICYLVYRKDFAELIRDIKDLLENDTKDQRKKFLIANMSIVAAVSTSWLFIFANTTSVSYSAKPIVLWAYQKLTGQHPTKVGLPFPAALPYRDMTQVDNTILYTFIFCLLAHSGNVTVLGVSGVDGAYLHFCLYLSAAYQCLQADIQQAFKRNIGDDFKCSANEQLCKDLISLIKRHQRIIVMCQRFNRVYNFIIFEHFVFASIILGVVLFDILLAPGISKTVYIAYGMSASTQVYMYCYGAQKLDENVLQLSETLYFCQWYKCDRNVRRLMLQIMARAQKGGLLKAPFFSPSLPLFAAIVKSSGSYITLLKTFF